MRSPRTLLVLVLLLVLVCFMPLTTPADQNAQAIPDDFKVVAQFGPGLSSWLAWKCTITSDGNIHQQVAKPRKGKGDAYEKKLTVSNKGIGALLAKVKAVDFFALDENYAARATDQNTLVLEITLNKKTHKVAVYGYSRIEDHEDQNDVDRFLKIWVEILTKVPSPNPEQMDRFKAGGPNGQTLAPPVHPSLRLTIKALLNSGYQNVAMSPDGKSVASITKGAGIKLWDAKTGKSTATLDTKEGELFSVAFSPDGKRLAAGGSGVMLLVDVASGQRIPGLVGPFRGQSLAFSPDGKMLASGGDKTVLVMDRLTGQTAKVMDGHAGKVQSVVFSPDGKTLASGGWDDVVKLWDVATGKAIATLEVNSPDSIHTVAFSPDGKRLVTVGRERNIKSTSGSQKTIQVWDVATGTNTGILKGHTGSVGWAAFSPDGKTLASASSDQTIKLWDLASGAILATLTGHSNTVTFVAFSPDGKTLVSGGLDQRIRVWDVPK